MGSFCCSAELPVPSERHPTVPVEMSSKVSFYSSEDLSADESEDVEEGDEACTKTPFTEPHIGATEDDTGNTDVSLSSSPPYTNTAAPPLPPLDPAAVERDSPYGDDTRAHDIRTRKIPSMDSLMESEINRAAATGLESLPAATSPTSRPPTHPTDGVEDEDGVYLTYAALNDGTLYTVWKKEAIPGALAFGRPKAGIRVPAFKYKGRLELTRHIHRSKRAPLLGILQFLRSIVPFQPDVSILKVTDPSIRIGALTFFAHLGSNRVIVVEQGGEPIHLPDVDMVAVCYSGTGTETDLRTFIASGEVTLNSFSIRCKQHGELVDTITLLGHE